MRTATPCALLKLRRPFVVGEDLNDISADWDAELAELLRRPFVVGEDLNTHA